ncbi:MAG: hypothetical protein BWX84_03239 [Verrucomicrobia bacterium ADurb.Bin118]|jgi:hypothetical protein|nr:hypothetical protein [Verrucomicrobiota bacterium]OQB88186.1 MAG: hypothetical protein BWX84_03239 [Verrucomicrobia bacterium ADurb.Bin118]
MDETWPPDNIGHPKLFMGWERALSKPAAQAVNNFAANRSATGIGMAFGFHFRYRFSGFPAPAGQVC